MVQTLLDSWSMQFRCFISLYQHLIWFNFSVFIFLLHVVSYVFIHLNLNYDFIFGLCFLWYIDEHHLTVFFPLCLSSIFFFIIIVSAFSRNTAKLLSVNRNEFVSTVNEKPRRVRMASWVKMRVSKYVSIVHRVLRVYCIILLFYTWAWTWCMSCWRLNEMVI